MLFTDFSVRLSLGEVGSGKTTLVAKLQGVEEYMKGRGLEYLYFSVHDDDIDGNQRLLAVHKNELPHPSALLFMSLQSNVSTWLYKSLHLYVS